MSSGKVAPLNLITQVDRPDIDYQGGISARRPKADDVQAQPQHPHAQPVAPVPLWRRIFCCFGGRRAHAPPAEDPHYLLPPLEPEFQNKKCLVLDLDETLVHSSFKPIPNADFIIPVEIEDHVHQVYVLKRPEVDTFMREMGDYYEVVVFTASLAKYADPVLDLLDKHRVVKHRLFREHCHNHKGTYVKDLGRMGRDLKSTIIIDNSPASYLFHPENAIPIESWFDDQNDRDLLELIPFLKELSKVSDIRTLIRQQYNVH